MAWQWDQVRGERTTPEGQGPGPRDPRLPPVELGGLVPLGPDRLGKPGGRGKRLESHGVQLLPGMPHGPLGAGLHHGLVLDVVVPGLAAESNPPGAVQGGDQMVVCLLYTSPSPRDVEESRMPSSA